MKCSMTGQEKVTFNTGDCNKGDHMDRFDCIYLTS
jgi:hypothetical protein